MQWATLKVAVSFYQEQQAALGDFLGKKPGK